MPTLIVEDGSGVTNANTYVDLIYLAAYAADRGLTIPTVDADKEKSLLKAMDYLESRRGEFQGSKTVGTQSLQWPRTGVSIDCNDLDSDVIPEELKKAQCQLVVEMQTGTRLYPSPRTSSIEGLVIEKTVGPLTKKFSANGYGLANSTKPVTIASVEIFILPLTVRGGCCSGPWKETIRV